MKKNFISMLIILLGIIIIIIGSTSLFIVRTDEQGVVLRFGKVIKVIQEPGLYIKVPFIDTVHIYTKKLLEYDAEPVTVVTQDKKNIVIDTIALFRITDPLIFYQRVRTIPGVQERLDDAIYSAVRVIIGKNNYDDILYKKRDLIQQEIINNARETTQGYGVTVEVIRFKRVFIPEENEKAIYQSMIAERQREAAKLRAEGQSEAIRIRSEADKKAKEILADAYKKAEITKGEGDAEAQRIISEVAKIDPLFYTFLQTMDFYSNHLKNTIIVISPDSDLFRYLIKYGGINP